MCYICKYTAYTMDYKWALVASKTSYLTHCTFNSCTRHLKLLSHRNREVPSPFWHPDSFIPPPFSLSIFPSKKVQTSLPPPLGNDWWSSHLMRYSSHTRHSDYFFSLTVIKQPQEKKCASAYSHQRSSSHTVTQSLTFSVHMLTAKA